MIRPMECRRYGFGARWTWAGGYLGVYVFKYLSVFEFHYVSGWSGTITKFS